MRKELNIAQTPSPTNDGPLLFPYNTGLIDRVTQTGRIDISAGQDAEEFTTIPVVFPIFGAKLSHNTAQINVSRSSPPTYSDLMETILSASEGLLMTLFEERNAVFSAMLGDLERSLSTSSCVYFVWDFAPPIHFTETGYTMPGYGTSVASHLGSIEFAECLRAAHTGRISYIFVAKTVAMDTRLQKPKQSQEETGEGKRHDRPPVTLSKKEVTPTAPRQAPPGSPDLDEVEEAFYIVTAASTAVVVVFVAAAAAAGRDRPVRTAGTSRSWPG
ncbi:hypothetical protein F5Y14DRAFT_453958 [Nemania sp. NC0429]|nr:hypothetical protein F5Y14DRAFT_453958 [Nemania sp. NC0429]